MADWVPQHSAGGVVVRQQDGMWQFLAIRPVHRDHWQLPKGTIDHGETVERAALREVREEGGVDAVLVESLDQVRYFYQADERKFVKTVSFFLMRFTGGNVDDHDHEVDEARWFPLDEPQRLTFPGEQHVVERAAELVAADEGGVFQQ